MGIAVSHNGDLWFTTTSNQIGRMSTTGKVAFFTVPTKNVTPYGIALGPQDVMWFCEFSGPNIGSVDGTGHITEYTIPPHPGTPQWIFEGPDAGMWFTEYGGQGHSDIGRIGAPQ
jgi:virginiamycin B lyase